MLAHHLFIRSDVDTVNFVLRDIAVQPLDLWSQVVQHAAGFLRDRDDLVWRYVANGRNIAFDDVFRHSSPCGGLPHTVRPCPASDSTTMREMAIAPRPRYIGLYIEGRMKKSKGKSSHRAAVAGASDPAAISSNLRVAVAIMAAGKGTRLKSQIPKVLHEVGGRPLLEHVIRAALRVRPAKDVFAIIGHEAEKVRAAVLHTRVNFVTQAEQRGTGHALLVAGDALAGYDHVIVLSGDAPLITPETIDSLLKF